MYENSLEITDLGCTCIKGNALISVLPEGSTPGVTMEICGRSRSQRGRKTIASMRLDNTWLKVCCGGIFLAFQPVIAWGITNRRLIEMLPGALASRKEESSHNIYTGKFHPDSHNFYPTVYTNSPFYSCLKCNQAFDIKVDLALLEMQNLLAF